MTRRMHSGLAQRQTLSLLDDDGATSLGTAIAQHNELVQARPARDRPGDTNRSPELQARPGWAWLRVMRRYDEYERALALVESGGDDLTAAQPQRPAEPAPSR